MSPSQDLNRALEILAAESEAALASLEEGAPFTSAVGYVYEKPAEEKSAGWVYLFLSDLARHTKNIKKNPNVSLLVISREKNAPIHEKERLSLQGALAALPDQGKHAALKAAYLKVFPRSEIFFGLPDFRFYQLRVNEIHWIGGFGRAERWEF